MAFVRYIHSGKLKEEFLFCTVLKSTTKASDILATMSTFFENNNLFWVNLCGICTDGAPAMIGSRSGFQALVKHRAPAAKGVHCIIHRQALASKTLPESLSYVLQQSINLVNYIKSSALNTRLFKKLCVFFTQEYAGYRKEARQQESFDFGMKSKYLRKTREN